MPSSEMDFTFMKQRIEDAVTDNLKTITNLKVDAGAAVKEILSYVFRNVNPDSVLADHARYDWYYSLLGKTIAIAQGWKINHAPEVKSAAETPASVREYIGKTYGEKL